MPNPYIGLVLGVALLGGVVALNIAIYRRRWSKYLTATEYLKAHPGFFKDGKPICYRCRSKPLSMGVPGKGRMFRCAFCENELYREDAT